MDSAQQPTAVNGSGYAARTSNSRLTEDNKIRVFHACLDDVEVIVDMLRDVHAESPNLSHDPFSESHATNAVMSLLSRSEEDTLALICYLNGEAVGCMGAVLAPQLTTEVLKATELLLYVYPEYRGSRAALNMVRAFIDWAEPYDMRVGSSLGIDDEKAVRFYEHFGFEKDSIGMSKRGTESV